MQRPKQDQAASGTREIDSSLRALLAHVLGLSDERVEAFDEGSLLFGALPEFDSMAVAALLTAIEEQFDVLIEDDDVEAEDFMTYGRLRAFVVRMATK